MFTANIHSSVLATDSSPENEVGWLMSRPFIGQQRVDIYSCFISLEENVFAWIMGNEM